MSQVTCADHTVFVCLDGRTLTCMGCGQPPRPAPPKPEPAIVEAKVVEPAAAEEPPAEGAPKPAERGVGVKTSKGAGSVKGGNARKGK